MAESFYFHSICVEDQQVIYRVDLERSQHRLVIINLQIVASIENHVVAPWGDLQ